MWDMHCENYQSEQTEGHNMNLVHHNKLKSLLETPI